MFSKQEVSDPIRQAAIDFVRERVQKVAVAAADGQSGEKLREGEMITAQSQALLPPPRKREPTTTP